MFDIDKFIADQIIKEGGAKFTNDPLDRGGATKYGVTEVAARAWGYAGKMEDLDYHTAFCILKERYWYAPHFDQVDNLSPVLSARCCEIGINMGVEWPGRFIQRALNVLNQEARLFPDLSVDGHIGRMTLYCLGQFIEQRKDVGLAVLIDMVNSQQRVRYMEIAERDAAQEKWEYGWQSQRV
jgi:lysozyme family protein